MSSPVIPVGSREYNRDTVLSSSYVGSEQIKIQTLSWHNHELQTRSSPQIPPTTINFNPTPIKLAKSNSQLSFDKLQTLNACSPPRSPVKSRKLSESFHQDDSDDTLSLLPQPVQYVQRAPGASIPIKVFKVLPAVFLALILNVLDALSYGIIIFPIVGSYIPTSATHAGISMFLMSTIISQLVFSLRIGSAIRGAVGSMMIEVMPFLYTMNRVVYSSMEGDTDEAILATVMICYALSTVLTGVVFFVLGKLKLGTSFIQFFPRHILVGCIGGIGVFLVATAIEVTSGMKLEWSVSVVKALFTFNILKVWLTSLAVAVCLKLAQRTIKHPLFVPIFYSTLPVIFFFVSFLCGYSIDELRDMGWLLNIPTMDDVPFYTFYSYYNFGLVKIPALIACAPTMLALALFGILHVPINVPAIALSTDQDVDLNGELMGHGVSNVIAGLFGTLQNYIVYSNSILYIRSGGDSSLAGFILALATAAVMVYGGSAVMLMPVVVVGA